MPEPYWDAIAERVKKRSSHSLLAGDEGPFYEYKRANFLKLLHSIEFENKTVLEVGSGPGSNLVEVYALDPKELFGVDISTKMIEISKNVIGKRKINLFKIDGRHLPFPDRKFDLSFTSTVLQHITDEKMLVELTANLCRVTQTDIYLFERVKKRKIKNESNTGRTIQEYETLFKSNFFYLTETRFLFTGISGFVCGGVRWLFNRCNRKEGEPETRFSVFLQRFALWFTKWMDKVFKAKGDLAMLHFTTRTNNPSK
ncbi:MAG: class I SAM-dependent methyltransferase [Sphingobacteriales bacterium]|nr:class I SAM-dependent methyltransferase [Sphingobacteriales bacterium]